ncbi:MAG: hypothetical protein LBU32_21780 [Clostridiales bacterium]|jgi:hypothetical protein|nr:hypothetical protein [Clostridiales bacterium]
MKINISEKIEMQKKRGFFSRLNRPLLRSGKDSGRPPHMGEEKVAIDRNACDKARKRLMFDKWKSKFWRKNFR